MNIDTLNAYCRSVPVTDLPLCQGRLKLDSSVYSFKLHCLVHFGQIKMPYVGAGCPMWEHTKLLVVEWVLRVVHTEIRLPALLTWSWRVET